MQINRHKNTIVYVRQTTTAFLLRKKKTNKGKLHMEIGLVWRVNGLQACKGKKLI